MPYIQLFAAIGFELIATTLLKCSEGFSKLVPTLACIGTYAICFLLLSKAVQHIDLSVAYATWCGLGIVATAVISVLAFKGQFSAMTVLGIALVVAGVIVLNLVGTAH